MGRCGRWCVVCIASACLLACFPELFRRLGVSAVVTISDSCWTLAGLDGTGRDWTGLDGTGRDWTRLDGTGRDWTGLHSTRVIGLGQGDLSSLRVDSSNALPGRDSALGHPISNAQVPTRDRAAVRCSRSQD